jgi:hypothetical protein
MVSYLVFVRVITFEQTGGFLGAFEKTKANINYVLFVRPSVRMEEVGSPWKDL